MTLASAEELMRGFVGPDVGVSAVAVTDDRDLHPVEDRAMARAVSSRRAEFAAGRRAARRAMQEIGHPPGAIPLAIDFAPIWPKGIEGSITHDGGMALAVAARTDVLRGIGIDMTDDSPLESDLIDEIMSGAEQDEAEADTLALTARRTFCVKETIYKALAPTVGHVFGFDAAHVRFSGGDSFELRLTRTLPPWGVGTVMSGRCGASNGKFFACLILGL